jgi:hypothetical protein
MFECVCIYKYTLFIYTHTLTQTRTHPHTHTHTHTQAYVLVFVFVCVFQHVSYCGIYFNVCAHIYLHTTYISIYTHTHVLCVSQYVIVAWLQTVELNFCRRVECDEARQVGGTETELRVFNLCLFADHVGIVTSLWPVL